MLSLCNDALDPCDVSYTLVLQLLDERIWMMRHHCARWGKDNPVSIAGFADRTEDDVTSKLASAGCSAEHLTLWVIGKTA